MSESIVFISHHRIRPGKRDELKELTEMVVPQIKANSPGTVAFLGYVDDAGTELTMIHVFPDAQAMDVHFQGATQRAEKASEMMEPQAYEIYGRASNAALSMARQLAARWDMALTVYPDSLGGFLRLAAGA
jgi:quinol monooxygenase YgiN